MSVRHLVHLVGLILLALSVALAVTTLAALLLGDGDWPAFMITTVIAAVAGLLGFRVTRLERELSPREGYAIVSLAWLAVGIVGSLPYLLAGVVATPVEALFESFSGFTTTGATVFSEIESLPRGILLWRSLTQWLGGMGIIVLGIAILPFLGIGGMQLFKAEVPGPTPERLRPRITQTAKLLWYVYAGLTAAQVLLYLVGGLSLFDAVTHALATLSTGGFSPRNDSIAAFSSPYVQYVTIAFMFMAGVNFALHFRAVSGDFKVYGRDAEWKFFVRVIATCSFAILLLLLLQGVYAREGFERAFRDSLFQTVSIATSTGFVSYDYGLWPLGAQLILVALMFMGGMAGSTAGGMKTMRVHVLLRHGFSELTKALHPKAVIVTRVGRTVVRDDVVLNIFGFAMLYLGLFCAGVLALALLGHDLATSIGASVSSIGNIGPGIGGVGAVDNYGWMGPGSHLVLIFLMVVGRLEIFTVMLLFHPDLWRTR